VVVLVVFSSVVGEVCGWVCEEVGGGGGGGGSYMPNSRAIVLQRCGQCRRAGRMKDD